MEVLVKSASEVAVHSAQLIASQVEFLASACTQDIRERNRVYRMYSAFSSHLWFHNTSQNNPCAFNLREDECVVGTVISTLLYFFFFQVENVAGIQNGFVHITRPDQISEVILH